LKPKVTLIISAFLTAAILTVAGGIITQTGNAKMAIAAAATQTNLFAGNARCGYQALINQANQTINQANAEIPACKTNYNNKRVLHGGQLCHFTRPSRNNSQ